MSTSSDPPSRAGERVGQILKGRWRLDALIGEGGMATVYAATHRNGNRSAVKILHPELARDPTTRERFVREGYVANRVGHPGAVRVLDDDTAEDGAVYLVMELLSGQSVADLQEATPTGRLDEATAIEIVIQLCDVLAAAHEAHIVHRDLKPENLFWTRERQVKVLDFGIARVREAAGVDGPTRRMTQTGNIMGTPSFMPPEQALGEGHRIDARTDVWATGATLFTLVSGRCVHEDSTAAKVLLRAMTRPVEPLAKVAPFVSPGLAEIVDRALAFEQEARWPSAREMGNALRALGPMAGDVVFAPTLLSSTDRPSGRPPRTVALAQPSSPDVVVGHHETLVTSSRSTLSSAKHTRWPWMLLGAAALFTAIAFVGWRTVQPRADVASSTESTGAEGSSEAGGRPARTGEVPPAEPTPEPTPPATPTVASSEASTAASDGASPVAKVAGPSPVVAPPPSGPTGATSTGATSTGADSGVATDPTPAPAPPASAKDFSGRF